MIDFLKKTFHITKFARGGIIEKHIVDVECDPPEFVVDQENLSEIIKELFAIKERKTMKQMILKKPLLDDLKGIKETLVGQGDPILASVLNRAIACVEKQPVVDAAEVVRGEWSTVEDDYCGLVALECSVCNNQWWFEDDASFGKYHYCPNCGAKMDGDGNDADH